MIHFLKEYFAFTRTQRNGVLVLLLLIIVLLLLPYLMPLFVTQEQIDFAEFQKEIAAFETQTHFPEKSGSGNDMEGITLFHFDPNELDEAGWKNLGVPEKTIRTILNYRTKGGHFSDADDLLRIYGFDTAKYEQLFPYIRIADVNVMNPLKKSVYTPVGKTTDKPVYYEQKKKPHREQQKIELNSADSALLVTVKGIGPVLSKRILKYRSKLGGYVHIEQLLEVYGMDSLWFESIKPALFVDAASAIKIPINTIPQSELEKHPYFRNNAAMKICNYRQQHGAFSSMDDLKKIYTLDEALIGKMEPYLRFE